MRYNHDLVFSYLAEHPNVTIIECSRAVHFPYDVTRQIMIKYYKERGIVNPPFTHKGKEDAVAEYFKNFPNATAEECSEATGCPYAIAKHQYNMLLWEKEPNWEVGLNHFLDITALRYKIFIKYRSMPPYKQDEISEKVYDLFDKWGGLCCCSEPQMLGCSFDDYQFDDMNTWIGLIKGDSEIFGSLAEFILVDEKNTTRKNLLEIQ